MPADIYRNTEVLLAMLAANVIVVNAQTAPMVTISRPPVHSIQLATPSDSPQSPLVGLKNYPALARSILVVTNHTDQAIVAISAIWKVEDSAGREKVWSQRCDVFLPAGAGKVIAKPHSELYMGPITCLAQKTPPVDLSPQIANSERQNVELLGAAAQIDITIDVVMFESGDMFAIDGSYAEDINARVAAAKDVAAHVRSGLAGGLTRQQLAQTLSDQGRSISGGQGSWFRDLSRSLLQQHGDYFDSYLAAMERLSVPRISVHKF